MDQLKIGISYQWQPVYLREKVEYLFPMTITPFMRTKYKVPAVFRWIVYERTVEDKKLVYIGEAQELCPKRLYGYLNPGLTQSANKKVNTEFRGYLREKLKIKLDICEIKEIAFGGAVSGTEALEDKYLRRMLVEAMIVEHKKRGFTVMDL
jgi:hypothetical protein